MVYGLDGARRPRIDGVSSRLILRRGQNLSRLMHYSFHRLICQSKLCRWLPLSGAVALGSVSCASVALHAASAPPKRYVPIVTPAHAPVGKPAPVKTTPVKGAPVITPPAV